MFYWCANDSTIFKIRNFRGKKISRIEKTAFFPAKVPVLTLRTGSLEIWDRYFDNTRFLPCIVLWIWSWKHIILNVCYFISLHVREVCWQAWVAVVAISYEDQDDDQDDDGNYDADYDASVIRWRQAWTQRNRFTLFSWDYNKSEKKICGGNSF